MSDIMKLMGQSGGPATNGGIFGMGNPVFGNGGPTPVGAPPVGVGNPVWGNGGPHPVPRSGGTGSGQGNGGAFGSYPNPVPPSGIGSPVWGNGPSGTQVNPAPSGNGFPHAVADPVWGNGNGTAAGGSTIPWEPLTPPGTGTLPSSIATAAAPNPFFSPYGTTAASGQMPDFRTILSSMMKGAR